MTTEVNARGFSQGRDREIRKLWLPLLIIASCVGVAVPDSERKQSRQSLPGRTDHDSAAWSLALRADNYKRALGSQGRAVTQHQSYNIIDFGDRRQKLARDGDRVTLPRIFCTHPRS